MNSIRKALATLALATLAVATFSCADSTAPSGASPNATQSVVPDAALGDALGLGLGRLVDTTVTVLQRLTPLSDDITRTEVIDSDGGLIVIPRAGFLLYVPRGALDQPTTITVTAVQGSAIAYEFEPHGLVFNRRPFFVQDLGVTAAASRLLGTGFTGAYFESRDEISPIGSAAVHELLPTRVGLFSQTVLFPIKHFSGYLVAVD
jgi:hypothetical protein